MKKKEPAKKIFIIGFMILLFLMAVAIMKEGDTVNFRIETEKQLKNLKIEINNEIAHLKRFDAIHRHDGQGGRSIYKLIPEKK